MKLNEQIKNMQHRIDELVPMNQLPTWLQELWELDSALARRAEKHYLELKQVKNIAYEPVLPAVNSDEIEDWVCKEFNITGLDYDENVRTQYGYLPSYFKKFAEWLTNGR